MTDKEIIKALECLFGCVDCRECPYSPMYEFPLCQQQVAKDTLDLITQQQAENENLKVENQSLRGAANSLKMHYEKAQSEIDSLKIFRGYAEKRASDYRTMRDKYLNAKSEAIKDFAERVKKELLLLKKECRKALDNDGVFAIERARKKIDNLVKEMVGESNE